MPRSNSCRTSGAAVLFALTYDGRIACTPAEPDDEAIRDLVNRHQRTDKGFGEAVGPDASDLAQEYFAGAGYEVTQTVADLCERPIAKALGIADSAIFYVEFWAKRVGIALPPNCAAHLERMLARPSVQRTLAAEGLA